MKISARPTLILVTYQLVIHQINMYTLLDLLTILLYINYQSRMYMSYVINTIS